MRAKRRRVLLVGLPAMVLGLVMVLGGCGSGNAGTSALSAIASSNQASAASQNVQPPGGQAATTTGATAVAATATPSSQPPPPPPATIAINPANGAEGVDPLAPITVTVADGTIDTVALTNANGDQIQGTLAPDQRSWTAATELGYGKTYTISSTAKNLAGVVNQAQSSFTTLVPNNKTAAKSFPRDGMTVGIAQPIAIFFDEPIADKAAAEQAITVTTTPSQVGGFRWISKQELRWRPQNFWLPGSKVSVAVKIYGKNLGDGIYGQQDLAFSFGIGRSMVAEIDDNTHMMTVTQDGQVINSIPVSMGRNEYPTYNGIHVVAEKYETKIMDSRTWGLTGAGAYRTEVAWATRISNSGEFVHAAPWSVWAQGSENVSHGCVNVSDDYAKWFYDTFIPGDPVIIRNTVGPALESWDGYGDFQLPFDQYVA